MNVTEIGGRPMKTKGIILAGGTGSRLFPATSAVSKQLLPVYDKPMIYYPITTLMNFGIRDIAVITNPHNTAQYISLLKDGSQWGINITYVVQLEPNGIPEAFLLTENFTRDADRIALILGDNIFHTDQDFYFSDHVEKKSRIFLYKVTDPCRYGVLELDKSIGHQPIRIVEKPIEPPSNWAVTGLYFYDTNVIDYAKELQPSPRGELEITDLNQMYLDNKELSTHFMGEDTAWFDSGTPDSLMDSAQYIQALQKRQGTLIGSPELTALQKGYIGRLEERPNNTYGKVLTSHLDRQ